MNQITVPFFTLPQNLVRAGILSDLKPCELFLLVGLHHEMERYSNAVLIMKNSDLHNLTGLSPSAIRLARTKLSERDIVSLQRVAGGMYEYSLLNPATKKPWARRRKGSGRTGERSGTDTADREQQGHEAVTDPAGATSEPKGVTLDF